MPIDLGAIHEEILAGLPNESGRLESALFNRYFYEGNFELFPVRAPDGFEPYRYQRTSRFLRWVVQVLTKNLYREGAARRLSRHPAASEFLERTYRQWWADSAWQDADRAATWGGWCAFQVLGTRDPDKPLRYYLWGADELVAWVDPEDPTCPAAIATIDKFDRERRLRLWTADFVDPETGEVATRGEFRTYLTEKWNGETSGRTAFHLVGREPNVYGVLPFATVHFEPPTARFTTCGPGDHLRQVNDWLNFTLTETGDSIRYDIRPVTLAYNVRAGWRPPAARPGSIWDIPAESVNAGGEGPEPRLEFHQADSGYIGATWEDIGEFLGHTLECYGIPRSAFRLERAAATSGVQVVAEELPILDWAQGRQRPFSRYEEGLAVTTLKVAAAHYRNNGISRAELDAAAADPGLVVRFGRMWPNLPGPERDQADQWRMAAGLASRIDVLMEREGLSREEAEAKLRQVAADRKLEQELLDATAAEAPRESTETAATRPDDDGGEDAGPDVEARVESDDE